jgi:hypothetical protein
MTGDIPHYLIPMDELIDDRVTNDKLPVLVHNGAQLVPGKVNNALLLRGPRQYVSITVLLVSAAFTCARVES